MANDGGIGRLKARLANIPKNVKEAVAPALMKQGEAMATTMRAFVAEEDGALKDSITVTPPDANTPAHSQPGGRMVVPETSVAVTAGGNAARHAHLIEYGTRERQHKNGKSTGVGPAMPFFWPAVRLHNKKARAAIKRSIGKAVKKEWGK